MPAVDRSVLRLGAYELRYEVTAPAVVINECLELAKALSTDDSGRYVNGVLESIRKHVASEPVPSGHVEAEPDDAPVEDAPVDESQRRGRAAVDDVPVDEAMLVAAEVPDELDAPTTATRDPRCPPPTRSSPTPRSRTSSMTRSSTTVTSVPRWWTSTPRWTPTDRSTTARPTTSPRSRHRTTRRRRSATSRTRTTPSQGQLF